MSIITLLMDPNRLLIACAGIGQYLISTYAESLSILHQLKNAFKGSPPGRGPGIHGLAMRSGRSLMGSVSGVHDQCDDALKSIITLVGNPMQHD